MLTILKIIPINVDIYFISCQNNKCLKNKIQSRREIIPRVGLIRSHLNNYGNPTVLSARKIYENELSLNAFVTWKAEWFIWHNQQNMDGIIKAQTKNRCCSDIVRDIKLLFREYLLLFLWLRNYTGTHVF